MNLYLMVGISGSGKTTWAKNFCEINKITYLSSDENRARLGEGEHDQTVSEAAFALLACECERELLFKRNVLLDACFISPLSREKFIDLGHEYDATICCLCRNEDPEICKERNSKRPLPVPLWVIERQAAKLEWPTASEADVIQFLIQ